MLFDYSVLVAYSPLARASPMKVAESMVNTMDWMKHTNSSRHIMNTLITTLTIDMPTIMTMPLATTRKMMMQEETRKEGKKRKDFVFGGFLTEKERIVYRTK